MLVIIFKFAMCWFTFFSATTFEEQTSEVVSYKQSDGMIKIRILKISLTLEVLNWLSLSSYEMNINYVTQCLKIAKKGSYQNLQWFQMATSFEMKESQNASKSRFLKILFK